MASPMAWPQIPSTIWAESRSQLAQLGCPNGHQHRRWQNDPALLQSRCKAPGQPKAGNIPSGKRLHSYGKSQFFMGKSTISMTIFNSFLYVYQRVKGWVTVSCAPISHRKIFHIVSFRFQLQLSGSQLQHHDKPVGLETWLSSGAPSQHERNIIISIANNDKVCVYIYIHIIYIIYIYICV